MFSWRCQAPSQGLPSRAEGTCQAFQLHPLPIRFHQTGDLPPSHEAQPPREGRNRQSRGRPQDIMGHERQTAFGEGGPRDGGRATQQKGSSHERLEQATKDTIHYVST